MKKSFFLRYFFLFLFWQFLVGEWDIANIVEGFIVVLLVTSLSIYFINSTELEKVLKLKHIIIFLKYFIKFLKEIVRANIKMAAIILNRDMPVSPALISFKTKLKKDVTRVILANTITLTPGTLTVKICGEKFTIHTINKDDPLNLNDLEELLLQLEGD